MFEYHYPLTHFEIALMATSFIAGIILRSFFVKRYPSLNPIKNTLRDIERHLQYTEVALARITANTDKPKSPEPVPSIEQQRAEFWKNVFDDAGEDMEEATRAANQAVESAFGPLKPQTPA